jgi:hypothetical protein
MELVQRRDLKIFHDLALDLSRKGMAFAGCGAKSMKLHHWKNPVLFQISKA